MSETLAVVDFDRTLYNTAVASEAYARAVSDEGLLQSHELGEVQELAQNTGVSFDPFEYVRQLGVTEQQLDRVTARFYELVQGRFEREILYPDAVPFMHRLANSGVPAVIMTYGNPEWQAIKLRSVGFDIWPHILTTEKYKGEAIAKWLNPENGVYHPIGVKNPGLPPYAGHQALRHVTLTDDKAASFRGLPAGATGYLLRREGIDILPSQLGDVGPSISVVSSLDQIEVESFRRAA